MAGKVIIENMNKFIIQLITENKDMVQNTEEFIMTEDTQDKIKEFVKNNFKSKNTKNTKKQKDPNAPKKNKSSYLFYCAKNRDIIKNKNPDATFGEVAKLVSAEWKKCKEKNGTEYKKYLELAKKDKERYELEWIEYKPSEGFEKKKKKSSEKKIKGKRNGYILFCNENRDKVKKSNPDKKGKEITKLLATLWKQEKAEESDEWKKFTELAREDKERYDREKSESESEKSESEKSESESEKSESESESEKSERESESEKSESESEKSEKKKKGWKGKGAAYEKFKKEKKEKDSKMKVKDIKEMWKSMSEQEQKKYTE